MPITCPCCRASNESATCRRCKADLSLLVALEDRREHHLTLARRFAAEGQCDAAMQHVDQATQLRPAADVKQLRAALLLLKDDFAAALQAYDEPA
jgi:uncharacterized protein YdcH (DUF465 family)